MHIRVVQIAPVYEAVHEQVLGAVQVPPFEQVGEQTARWKQDYNIDFRQFIETYVLYNGYHYMSMDKCTYQDLNTFHHLNK